MNPDRIMLAQGAGGEAMRRFIRDLFVKIFDDPELNALADSALVTVDSQRLAFSTDCYTVKPLEFPGGDIGKLCVAGTVNDLAVVGAKPVYLSLGCILEEGLEVERLKKFTESAATTAKESDVRIVTGDTKVVPRGECDGLFLITSGIGVRPLGHGLCGQSPSPGDAILINGTIGDHGLAILGAREGLSFETTITSDCAALSGLIESVLSVSDGVKWMRDATRGGLAAVLSELVEDQPFGALIDEPAIPVRDDVHAICELLGFEPMHLANEGKVILVVKSEQAGDVLALLRKHPLGRAAAIIGRVTEDISGHVRLQTETGGVRRLHRPAGELLPRIC